MTQNKIDVSAMSPEEQKAFKMYGKVPAKNLLTKMQKVSRPPFPFRVLPLIC